MKKFVHLFVLFAILQAIGTAAVLFLETKFIQRKASFKLPDSITMVVAGNSHPEVAFNDSLVKSLKNVSFSGEALNYTYAKLRMFIAQNPNIKIAFIEFGESELFLRDDTRIWTDKYIFQHYSTLFPFLERRDHEMVGQHNPLGLIKGLLWNSRTICNRLVNRDYNYSQKVGGYRFLSKVKSDSASQNGYHADFESASSDYSISTMNAMINYCHAHGVRIILVRSPLHVQVRAALRNSPLRQTIQREFKGIEFLDFGAFRAEDAEFADLDHLNYKGARRFSNCFNQLLKDGLLNVADKQKMIDENIEFRK